MAAKKKAVPWSDAEHDLLVVCGKANIPFNWVERVLGRRPRTSQSHALATGIKASVWGGRIPYSKARELRGKFAIICSEHEKKHKVKLRRLP